MIRKVGALPKYLTLALVGGVLIGLLSAVPTTGLRLHHYIIALVLVCFCAFPTRLSLCYCAFLLGMYIAGVGRWGFDGLIQDTAAIVGQGVYGTGIPSFLAPDTFNASALQVQWNGLPQQGADEVAWDGFQLLVDDVLRYIGPATSFNLSSLFDDYAGANTTSYPGGAAALNETIRSQPRECARGPTSCPVLTSFSCLQTTCASRTPPPAWPATLRAPPWPTSTAPSSRLHGARRKWASHSCRFIRTGCGR